MSAFAEGRSNGQKYAQGGGDHTVTHILCDKKNIMSLVQSTAKMPVSPRFCELCFCFFPCISMSINAFKSVPAIVIKDYLISVMRHEEVL